MADPKNSAAIIQLQSELLSYIQGGMDYETAARKLMFVHFLDPRVTTDDITTALRTSGLASHNTTKTGQPHSTAKQKPPAPFPVSMPPSSGGQSLNESASKWMNKSLQPWAARTFTKTPYEGKLTTETNGDWRGQDVRPNIGAPGAFASAIGSNPAVTMPGGTPSFGAPLPPTSTTSTTPKQGIYPEKAGTQEVVSIGGHDFFVIYDENGVPTYEHLGATDTTSTALTDQLQKYQQALRFSEASNKGQVFEQNRGTSQYSATNERNFEDMRRDLLDSLASPRDWITRGQVQGARNPYSYQPEQITTQSQNLSFEAGKARQEADYWTTIGNMYQSNPDIGNFYGVTGQDIGKLVADANNRATSLEAQLAGVPFNAGLLKETPTGFERTSFPASTQIGTAGASQPAPRASDALSEAELWKLQGLPIAPDWLTSLVPGSRGLTGQIQKAPMVTPSQQQYAAMPWSQREQLAGYSEYTGKPWENILNQMAMMAPNTPKSGASNWKPRRQWGV